MAIRYVEEPLPKVSSFAFDINHWSGVNQIKASQYDHEMSDCTNMSSDNFPYASPRKARKKLIDEEGIKRIYKVSDGIVYYIDKDGYLCYQEDGQKNKVTYTDDEENVNDIIVSDCICTNNYDDNTVFYPEMMYIDCDNKRVDIGRHLSFGTVPYNATETTTTSNQLRYTLEIYSNSIFVENTDAKTVKLSMTLPYNADGLYSFDDVYNYGYEPTIYLYVYDVNGKEKWSKPQLALITARSNSFTFDISGVNLEEGDYLKVVFRMSITGTSGWRLEEWRNELIYLKSADWWVDRVDDKVSLCTLPLDYGCVYNNRIVGVHKNDIRASALGDFSNFWEYADEAGNPSATGAYATDVGSAGDFTGICAYNNVLLLFKKNIVYEMYGSMPYTITELCSTGCIDNDSVCEIDGVLYWASPKGVVRYSGGVPTVISEMIDIDVKGKCKAGTDGRKYYVYDGKKIFVYDTYYRAWHIEDDKEVTMFYNDVTDLYILTPDGVYLANQGTEYVDWEFETKDFNFYSQNRKNLSKLWIRTQMEKQSNLEVYARQDGGEWKRVAVKTAERDEMFDFKLRIKKCDSFALKFKGKGDVRILDIHGKVTVGTSKHKSGASLNVYRR